MWTLLAPTKTKLLVTVVILAAMWISEALPSYLWMLLMFLPKDAFKDAFDEMARKVAEAGQDLLSSAPLAGRMMMFLPLTEWISKVVFSYLAACIVMRIGGSPNLPLQSTSGAAGQGRFGR
jgi:hypothetical protein